MTATDGLPLDSERWARLESLFHEAAALPTSEREAFLDEACADDAALKARLVQLLSADTAPDAIVDADLVEWARPLLGSDAMPEEPETLPGGTIVGRYRLLDAIGWGGMGAVYRAERADGAYEQQVALKLVRAGRFDERNRARFVREREILARLVHPGIATLLDGGVSDTGQPYLAMELVDGLPITKYADERSLDVSGRLELMIQVAEAVDYAHRNLVVHRDLKPSNVLVTDAGLVKLLDFGIARIVAEDGEGGDPTRTAALMLTPAYAAPEQILGSNVTTAVDIYAMGVVLYELLAGRRPFGDVGSSWGDIQRVLETEPPPVSQAQGVDRVMARLLRGDLDTIVSKAMHRDPLRRYGSAGDFADDLRRHLSGRPVEARPDSIRYRFGKLVRRNAAASIASAALVSAVVLGSIGTLWQARLAEREAERRDAVSDFVVGVFEGADPDATPGEPVTAVELLEAGLERIDGLEGGPEVRVDLLVVLGTLFERLGQYERAEPVLRQAVSEAVATLPPRDPAIANARDALGQLVTQVGEVEEGTELLRAALAGRSGDGSTPEQIAATKSNLALALRGLGETEEAAGLYNEVIAEALASNGGDSLTIVSELLGLGQVRQWEDDYDEALRLFSEARRIKEEAGARDAQLAHIIHNMGVVHGVVDRQPQAKTLHDEALDLWLWLFPDGHPEIARSYEALGRTTELMGRWQEADSMFNLAIGTWSALYGDDHAQIATIRVNQANMSYRRGDFETAAAAYRDGIAIWRAGGEQMLLGSGLRNLGIIERERGDYVASDTLLAEAAEVRRAIAGENSALVGEVYSALAGLRNKQGQHAEAATMAERARTMLTEFLGPEHRFVLSSTLEEGLALVELGRAEDALPVLEGLYETFDRTLNEADANRGRAALWLGVAAARTGDASRARTLIGDALPILENALGSSAPESQRARAELEALGG